MRNSVVRRLSSFVRVVAAAALTGGLTACGGGATGPARNGNGGGSDANANTAPPARISGQLQVLANPAMPTILEQEPNDIADHPQFMAVVREGQTYTILGTIAAGPPENDVDAFRFTGNDTLEISFRLTLEDPDAAEQAAFDVGVIDFVQANCALGPGPPTFANCFSGDSSGTQGVITVSGPYDLVVVPRSDGATRGPYRLEVSARGPSATNAAAHGARNAVASPHAPPAAAVRGYEPPRGEFREGEVLIDFDPALTAAERAAVLQARSAEMLLASASGLCRVRIPLPANADPLLRRLRTYGAALALSCCPGVRMAEPDYIFHAARTPGDEFYNLQWHYPAIQLPEAWDVTIGSPDVIVAVIDTGALVGHEELGPRLIDGFDFISDTFEALDGNGADSNADDPGDAPDAPTGSTFHGTHVAGTIGAVSDNAAGVAGVTWTCPIMPLRALGRGGAGSSFDIAEAIRYATGLSNASGDVPARRASVINMSLSSGAGNPPSQCIGSAAQAAVAAGVVVIAAAGNDGSDLPDFPAAFDDVIGVGAVDLNLARAEYSNFGINADLVAPGGDVGVDLNGDNFPDGVLSTLGDDRLGRIEFVLAFNNGTSMSSPHAAGVAALVLSVNPTLTPAEVRSILINTATDLGAPGNDDQFGAGLINAAAAVNAALTGVGEPPPTTGPRLSLNTSSVDLGNDRSTATIAISNTGGGTLMIAEVTDRELSGSGWLSATLSGGGASTSADRLEISIDRTGLPDGSSFRGIVSVSAGAAGDAQVDVAMAVGRDDPAARETVFVLVVVPGTFDAVRSAEANAANDFTFDLTGIPPGDYLLFAGTDRDGDDVICDSGELCGVLPSVIEPTVITLTPGGELTDVRFPVTELLLSAQSAGSPLVRPIRRR